MVYYTEDNTTTTTKSLYCLNYPHSYLMRVPSVALGSHVMYYTDCSPA